MSSCAFSVASLDHAARKPGSQNTFETDVKELLRARYLALHRLLSAPFGFVFIGFMSYFEQYEKLGTCAGQPAQRKGAQSADKAGSKHICYAAGHVPNPSYFGQLISDRQHQQHEMYSELASFTGGRPEDFLTSNIADEEQWVADLYIKLEVNKSTKLTLLNLTRVLQSLRSQEAIQTYLNKTSAVKKSAIICAASLAAIRLGRHMLMIFPPENLKAIACV